MADRVKVDRECPRCHVRAYHLGNDGGIPHRISCVNCGHIWTGRIRNDEQKFESKVKDGWDALDALGVPGTEGGKQG